MTDSPPGPMGCVLDPVATNETIISLMMDGKSPVCSDNAEIRGAWSRAKARGVVAVLLPRIQSKLFPNRKADYQRRGTCVGRGTYRAAWLSYLAAIESRKLIGRPVVLAYEPIYAGSRVEIGGGRISGDGAVGAYAAKWLSLFGTTERVRIGQYDLSTDSPEGREDLAVSWGSRGAGVPPEVEAECLKHTFDAHIAKNVEEQMDLLACGFAGAFCRGRLNGKRDENGMARPAGSGAHCEAVVGVFIGANGEDALLMQQSWGDQPAGPSFLKIKGGDDYKLPQGCYGIYADDQSAVWQSFAESWHFECPEGSQWR